MRCLLVVIRMIRGSRFFINLERDSLVQFCATGITIMK